MPGPRRFPLPLIAAFFALYVIWGSTYLVIRIGVEYWPPLMLGGIRFLLAGAAMYAFLRWRGAPAPTWEQWKAAAKIGILLLMLLTSKGAATVSGGSFVVFAATVTSTGILPLEGLAVIFGVYRFLSMAIATCNTIGNSVATVVVAKWSGTFDAALAEKHLYPERYPQVANEEEDLNRGNDALSKSRVNQVQDVNM